MIGCINSLIHASIHIGYMFHTTLYVNVTIFIDYIGAISCSQGPQQGAGVQLPLVECRTAKQEMAGIGSRDGGPAPARGVSALNSILDPV